MDSVEWYKLTGYTLHLWLLPPSVRHAAHHRLVALCEATITFVTHYGVDRVAMPRAAQQSGILHFRRRRAHNY